MARVDHRAMASAAPSLNMQRGATPLITRRSSPEVAIARASAGPSTRWFALEAPTALPTPSALPGPSPARADKRPPRWRLLVQTHAPPIGEQNLLGVRQVVQVHLLHRLRERFVIHRDIEFPVTDPAGEMRFVEPTLAQRESATAVFACSGDPFHSKTRTPASSSGRYPARESDPMSGTSLDPGTSSRTSTPSVAADFNACTYSVVPTKYASVSQSERHAPAAMG